MNEIFINYVSEFAKPQTRPTAHVRAYALLSKHEEQLNPVQIKVLLSHITSFAGKYTNAWPWSRGRVVADAIREFSMSLQILNEQL